MKSNKEKWIFTAVLAAVEIFLTAADLGFFTIGRIAFTILHIPVFLAVTLIGLPQGVILAAIFGFSSMISSYLHARGMLDYLFQNPLISVVPRLMIPFAVWGVYKVVCYIADDNTLSADLICTGFAALSGVIANAAFVIIAIAVLVPEAVGITEDLTASTIVVTNIVAINMVYEIVIAVAVMCLTVLALRKRESMSAAGTSGEQASDSRGGVVEDAAEGGMPEAVKSEGGMLKALAEEEAHVDEERGSQPIRKTFRKWLFLFMVMTFFLMLVFLHSLFSKQERGHAEVLLSGEADMIAGEIKSFGTDIREESLTIGREGVIVIARDNVILASGLDSLEVTRLSDLCPGYDKEEKGKVTDLRLNAVSGMGLIEEVNGITAVLFIPESEIYSGRNQSLAYLLLGLLGLSLLLFEIISVLVQRNVVQRIQLVNKSLGRIRAGDLDERVKVGGNTEFEELSFGINTTVDALKETMRQIEEKNRQEMEFAREVQNSALPSGSLFGQGFVVLGSMQAARDVGGDFYDYFLIGEDKLGVVVADVSGKGVPAALFMMTAKTLIKNFVLGGKSPAEALQLANVQLCENNEKGMFVTVWLGVLDLSSGRLEFANAAHNPPLLKKKGEPFQYMDYKKYRRGLVLGGLPESVYRNNEISLSEGDVLFLYTDGVTEAANHDLKLYGEDRLLACLEKNYKLAPEVLLGAVRRDLDAFAAGMEQYDDITMVVLKMR